jgi:hypothetical protein
MKIYVDLPDELVSAWCPVEAEALGGDVYRIIEVNTDPVDTRWAFDTGATVRCKWISNVSEDRSKNVQILVAYEQVFDFPSTNI